MTGISAGAINAASITMFPKGREVDAKEYLLSRWSTIGKKDVYQDWSPGGIIGTRIRRVDG